MSGRAGLVVLLGVAVVAAGLVVGVRGCGGGAGGGGAASERGGGAARGDGVGGEVSVGVGGSSSEDAGVDAAVSGVAVVDRAGLGEAMRGTLAGYRSDAEGFLAMLASQGVEPSAPMLTEWFGEDGWSIVRGLVGGASLDVAGSSVMDVRGGVSYVGEPGETVFTSRRDEGRVFLRDWRAGELDRVEWVVPGAFSGEGGGRFEGVLVIEFTRDTEEERWVFTELRLHAPAGVRVTMPPA